MESKQGNLKRNLDSPALWLSNDTYQAMVAKGDTLTLGTV